MTADDIESAAGVAFACEGVDDARALIALGREWYPEHPGLAKLQSDIAPPSVSSGPPSRSNQEAWRRNRAWVGAHGGAYAGRWVAVSNGELVAAAARPADLPRALPAGTLIVRVPRG